MTLKRKIAVNIAIAFSLLFAVSAGVIYYSFSSFRKDEFKERLEEKALTTAKLLLEVKEIDKQTLKIIDQNSINKLYNEKTLVFNDSLRLIYSSLDDATIGWNREDLITLKKEKSFFKLDDDKDLLGVFYDFDQTDYYVLIAAEDKYGNNKLNFLFYTLLFTFLGGTLLVWLSTYFFIKKQLAPLDEFEQQITNITANKLNIRLHETNENDEINLLTKAFNQMLIRIDEAFIGQKEFTSNASHEIRTPLTRIAFQVEHLLHLPNNTPESLSYLQSISNDVHQLSDLVNSLLLLSKISKNDVKGNFTKERIDEIIFQAWGTVRKQEKNCELDFEIKYNETGDPDLEISGIRSLLEIAFVNLLKNACLYSENKRIMVSIIPDNQATISVLICNKGKTLNPEEQEKIFTSFFRGHNATNIYGSGLGLRITRRIFDHHNVNIRYSIPEPNTNCFEITFNSYV